MGKFFISLFIILFSSGMVWQAIHIEELSSEVKRINGLLSGERLFKSLNSSQKILEDSEPKLQNISASAISIAKIMDKNLKLASKLNVSDKWEKSYDQGMKLKRAEKLNDASYYFINALSQSPGNVDIIKEYSDIIFNIAKEQKNTESSIAQLSSLEGFLYGQIPFVKTDDIPFLLKEISKVSSKKKEFLKQERFTLDQDNINNQEPLATQINSLLLERTSENDLVATKEYLVKLELLRKQLYSNPSQDNTLKRALNERINNIKVLLLYKQLLAEGIGWLNLAKKEKTPTIEAYYLQLAEGVTRELVVIRESLRSDQMEKVDHFIRELTVLSENLVKERTESLSYLIWVDFQREHDINSILRRNKLIKSNYSAYPNHECQNKIKELADLGEKLQNVLVKISDEEIRKIASEKFSLIGEEINKLQNEQARRYNIWTMGVIEETFSKGLAHLGYTDDDEEKLGDEIVNYMGIIDVRLLTMETNRCYTEVFEKLFSELEAASSATDFETKGYKLNVLKRMLEQEKTKVNQF